jgi:hypothetical protein
MWLLQWTTIISLDSINHLVFVIYMFYVSFEERSECLNIIMSSFVFEGLILIHHH